MYQRLFQISIVLFFVVVSMVIVAMIVTALLSSFASPMLARHEGAVFAFTGLELRRFAYMIIAGSLLIAGFYIFIRRRRFHR